MKRQYIPWTTEEIGFLKNHYYSGSEQFLVKHLRNRNWKSIVKKASVLGFKQKKTNLSDLSILLEDTHIAYYWIGFLMADGTFTDRRICLGVASKDLNHLIKFKNFVNSTNKIWSNKKVDYHRLKLTGVNEVQLIRNKFSISNRKTYEPCNITKITNTDLLFSLIIGLIDGDGCISKRKSSHSFSLSISMHPSWVKNLSFVKRFLHDHFGEKITSKDAYIRTHRTCLPQDITKTKKEYQISHMYISKRSLLIKIKHKADELGLPYLERKFGIIV